MTSVTRLGDLWNFLMTIFHAKVAKIYGDFLGYFETTNFQVKTAASTFGAFLGKFGQLFTSASGRTDHRWPSWFKITYERESALARRCF